MIDVLIGMLIIIYRLSFDFTCFPLNLKSISFGEKWELNLCGFGKVQTLDPLKINMKCN